MSAATLDLNETYGCLALGALAQALADLTPEMRARINPDTCVADETDDDGVPVLDDFCLYDQAFAYRHPTRPCSGTVADEIIIERHGGDFGNWHPDWEGIMRRAAITVDWNCESPMTPDKRDFLRRALALAETLAAG